MRALPDELRKDYRVVVRFLESDKDLLLKQASKHKVKTLADYIRKLIREDIAKGKVKSLPDIC
jgi:hypothetical protein